MKTLISSLLCIVSLMTFANEPVKSHKRMKFLQTAQLSFFNQHYNSYSLHCNRIDDSSISHFNFFSFNKILCNNEFVTEMKRRCNEVSDNSKSSSLNLDSHLIADDSQFKCFNTNADIISNDIEQSRLLISTFAVSDNSQASMLNSNSTTISDNSISIEIVNNSNKIMDDSKSKDVAISTQLISDNSHSLDLKNNVIKLSDDSKAIQLKDKSSLIDNNNRDIIGLSNKSYNVVDDSQTTSCHFSTDKVQFNKAINRIEQNCKNTESIAYVRKNNSIANEQDVNINLFSYGSIYQKIYIEFNKSNSAAEQENVMKIFQDTFDAEQKSKTRKLKIKNL